MHSAAAAQLPSRRDLRHAARYPNAVLKLPDTAADLDADAHVDAVR
jgi:hypothetical protein